MVISICLDFSEMNGQLGSSFSAQREEFGYRWIGVAADLGGGGAHLTESDTVRSVERLSLPPAAVARILCGCRQTGVAAAWADRGTTPL